MNIKKALKEKNRLVKEILDLHGGPNKSNESEQDVRIINVDMSDYTYKGEPITHYNIDGAVMAEVVISVLKNTESIKTDKDLHKLNQEIQKQLREAEEN